MARFPKAEPKIEQLARRIADGLEHGNGGPRQAIHSKKQEHPLCRQVGRVGALSSDTATLLGVPITTPTCHPPTNHNVGKRKPVRVHPNGSPMSSQSVAWGR